MNRQEFIDFLLQEEENHKHVGHWCKSASNSDMYWGYHVPCVDGDFPQLTVKENSVFVMTDGMTSKVTETEYLFDEFVKIMYDI